MHVKTKYVTSSTISSYNACTALVVTCASLSAKHFSTVTVKNFQKSIQAVWSPNHTSTVFRSGLTLRWVNRWAIISTTSYTHIEYVHKIKYLYVNQPSNAIIIKCVYTVYVCMWLNLRKSSMYAQLKLKSFNKKGAFKH